MRVALPVGVDGRSVTGLVDSHQVIIQDTQGASVEHLASPARTATSARRLAVVEALLAHEVDLVYTVPLAFCTASYAVAQVAGVRFIPVEPETSATLLLQHAEALALTARLDVPSSWLAEPVAVERGVAPERTLDEVTVAALVRRLRRVEGQARGLQRLVEGHAPVDQVLTQLAAMRAALNAVGLALLAENLAACLAGTPEDPDQRARIAAAKQAFQRLN